MTRLINRFFSAAEKRWPRWRWFFLIFVIVYRSFEAIVTLDASEDYLALIANTKEWLRSGQLGILAADPGNLSQSVYIPQKYWPPGFNFLLAPFLFVFQDALWPMVILNLVGVAIFFISMFMILEDTRDIFGFKAMVSIWIYWAICTAPFGTFYNSQLTDLLAVAFFFLSFSLYLRFFIHGSLTWALSAGVCAGLSALIRIPYWVLSPVLMVSLMAGSFGLIDREKKKKFLLSLVPGSALLCFSMAWIKVTTGSFQNNMFHVLPVPQWNHLRHPANFPLLGFSFDSSWQFISTFLGLAPELVAFIVQTICTVGAVCAFIFIYGQLLAQSRQNNQKSKFRITARVLSVVAISSSIACVGLLIYLAVYRAPAFIETQRYYYLTVPFFVWSIFGFLYWHGSPRWSTVIKITKTCLLLLLVVGSFNSILVPCKLGDRFLGPFSFESFSSRGRDSGFFADLLKSNLDPARPTVYADDTHPESKRYWYRRLTASMMGVPFAMPSRGVQLATGKPINLILGRMKESSLNLELRQLASSPRATKIGESRDGEMEFFRLPMDPVQK